MSVAVQIDEEYGFTLGKGEGAIYSLVVDAKISLIYCMQLWLFLI